MVIVMNFFKNKKLWLYCGTTRNGNRKNWQP